MRSGDPCIVQCGRLGLEGGVRGGEFEGRPCFGCLMKNTVIRLYFI